MASAASCSVWEPWVCLGGSDVHVCEGLCSLLPTPRLPETALTPNLITF